MLPREIGMFGFMVGLIIITFELELQRTGNANCWLTIEIY